MSYLLWIVIITCIVIITLRSEDHENLYTKQTTAHSWLVYY